MAQKFEELVTMASQSDSTVLITGPTGTGKTVLAQKIHQSSTRSAGPFVSINLACLHEGTLESELFGHEKGSFTGAVQKRLGKLEMAHGGTVFLDEVGELPLHLQARLLDFLQSRLVTPVGGNQPVFLNVRVIAATHRDLEEMIRVKQFREDLFHRIRVIPIRLLALSQRFMEFDRIVQTLLKELAGQMEFQDPVMAGPLVAELKAYSWPGNIRELRNLLEFCLVAARGQEITREHLPDWFLSRGPFEEAFGGLSRQKAGQREGQKDQKGEFLDYLTSRDAFEKSYLSRALSYNRGRVARTAQQIGMSKATLLRRIKAYQFDMQSF